MVSGANSGKMLLKGCVRNLTCAASLNVNEGKIRLPLIGHLAFISSEPSVN